MAAAPPDVQRVRAAGRRAERPAGHAVLAGLAPQPHALAAVPHRDAGGSMRLPARVRARVRVRVRARVRVRVRARLPEG